MSIPRHYLREAEHLSYGLLAAKAKKAMGSLLRKEQLNEDDIESLNSARAFLFEIADGAALVSTGRCQNHGAKESMKALDYAMGPLEFLQSAIQNQDISEFFRLMADSIPKSANEFDKCLREKKENLNNVDQFFNVLYTSLTEVMDTERPSIGDQNRISAHAF